MTTSTLTLADFIRARLEEDEAVALAGQETGDGWWHDGEGEVWSHMQLVSHPTHVSHAAHIARHDPARVLAEVAAKRELLYLHDDVEVRYQGRLRFRRAHLDIPTCVTCGHLSPCDSLRAISLPYSDHPDYDERWRP